MESHGILNFFFLGLESHGMLISHGKSVQSQQCCTKIMQGIKNLVNSHKILNEQLFYSFILANMPKKVIDGYLKQLILK